MARLNIVVWPIGVWIRVEDVQGQAWEVEIDDAWKKSGVGDSSFSEVFSVGDHTAVLRGIAFPVQTQTFRVLQAEYVSPPTMPLPPPPVFPTKPGEPIPLPVHVDNLGAITEVCDLLGQGKNGNFFYTYRNRYTDQQGSWHRDMREMEAEGKRNSICQGHAPPTAIDWQDGIQKQVTAGFDALSKYVTDSLKSVTESWQNGLIQGISDLAGKIETDAAEWRKAVNGIWDKLEGWMIERIVGILLKGLDREVEVMKKNGRT